MTMKTEDEIEQVVGNCLESIATGKSKSPAKFYHEGIEMALRWVRGELDDEELGFPFEDAS